MTAWNLKKVESTNLRLHGICVVGRLPKDSVDLKKRVPSLSRRYGRTLARHNTSPPASLFNIIASLLIQAIALELSPV
jgi:hypothetical protein